jgi:ATP-dependent DNA helicase RecQ
VFRQLTARGYLRVDAEGFGTLQLNPSARPLLRGEEQLLLRRDPRGSSTASERSTSRQSLPADMDNTLWSALRQCRRELAEAQGIPPYVIFHDRTLQEMCVQQPRSLAEFAALAGVGERKLQKYGPAFMAVIEHHQAAAY